MNSNFLSALLVPLLVLHSASSHLVKPHDSFSIRLLHRDYQSAEVLSRADRVRNAVIRSKKRSHKIFSKVAGLTIPYDAEAPLVYGDYEYNMEFELGTPPVTFQAIMDTGSDLVWVQCKPCESCYKQKGPTFSPGKSSSYKLVPCNNTICTNLGSCDESKCTYEYGYGDGSNTSGDLATEVVTMASTSGKTQNVGKIVFGCGHDNSEGFGTVGGLVGLGQGPASLIAQLSSKFESRFSYCMASFDDAMNKTSSMYFGASAKLSGHGIKSTPIIHNSKIDGTYYYINVEGISVHGKQLTPKSGSVSELMKNNTIIDSGTTLTYLASDVYDALQLELQKHISLPKVDGSAAGFDLCYNKASEMSYKFPRLIFHFDKADIDLPQENYFISINDEGTHVCFSMADSGDFSIIGNLQQQNFHISYDVAASQLLFKATTC